jgi:hypothetical protein
LTDARIPDRAKYDADGRRLSPSKALQAVATRRGPAAIARAARTIVVLGGRRLTRLRWRAEGSIRSRARVPTFAFAGDEYSYFVHHHNATWRNERAVEIAIVRRELDRRPGARVLEVGNVMAHYFPIRHVVVDKFEAGPNVRNEDILDHRPAGPYDLIVSISTLEHVGWDDTPRQPERAVWAVKHLRTLLSEDGRAVILAPLGYNPRFDAAVHDGALAVDDLRFLQRVGRMRWREVAQSSVRSAVYGQPYPKANAVVVATIGR